MVRLKELKLMYHEVNWRVKRWWSKKSIVDCETVESLQLLIMTSSRIPPWSKDKKH